MDEDQNHAHRYVESIVLGEIADQAFEQECRRVGVDVRRALDAPLTTIALAMARLLGRA